MPKQAKRILLSFLDKKLSFSLTQIHTQTYPNFFSSIKLTNRFVLIRLENNISDMRAALHDIEAVASHYLIL